MEELTYKTTDFSFACILYYLEKEILGLEGDIKKTFIFKDDGQTEDIYLKYIQGKLQVEPRKFWEAIRVIKSFLHKNI